ncbi:unnamed protein product [Trichobilharzia szidati]|nr:unnamed protein product [Trichobilharzia szidati]
MSKGKSSPVPIDSLKKGKYLSSEHEKECSDTYSICVLMFLYILQGIPLGLAAAVPYLLQSDPKTINYQLQATFSFVTWPFSLKLAWAPIVDSLYSSRIGRRKTWLIPVQYAIGIDLLILARYIDHWLGRTSDNPWGPLGVTHPVNIFSLTFAFFGLTFLAATQDIAVDGWALTMLSKKNLGWASTCNTVGQTLGYVIAFILFMCLESPDISNTYIRSIPVEGKGIITFSGFLYFWGVVFLVSTTLVGIFKKEITNDSGNQSPKHSDRAHISYDNNNLLTVSSNKSEDKQHNRLSRSRNRISDEDNRSNKQVHSDHGDDDYDRLIDSTATQYPLDGRSHIIEISPNEQLNTIESNEELSLIDTYRVMLGICRLKPIMQYIMFLFIVKVCFSASDNISGLKLIEQGLPKERLAFIGILLLPLQAVLPLFIIKITNGPKVLSYYTWAILPRLFLASLSVPLVHFAPYFKIPNQIPSMMHDNYTMNSGSSIPEGGGGGVTHVSFSWLFYVLIISHLFIYSVLTNIMFITQMAFHARISDPAVGGTYMTLLNTAANLATSLPNTIFLSLVEPLTVRICSGADILKAGLLSLQTKSIQSGYVMNTSEISHYPNDVLYTHGQSWLTHNATCKDAKTIQACHTIGGVCSNLFDGFYIEVVLSILFGLFTFPTIVRPLANQLDMLPNEAFTFHLPSKLSSHKSRHHQGMFKKTVEKVRKD